MSASYALHPAMDADGKLRAQQLEHERDPLLPPNSAAVYANVGGRPVVVVHDSPSRDICLAIVYGCCIFWILIIIVILILVICYEAGAFGDDDYAR